MANQPTHEGENSLQLLRDELQVQINQLAQHNTDPFDERLWQILAAYRREIVRKINREQGSAKVFQDTYIFWIAAIRLFAQHIERLSAKRQQDLLFDSKDWMVNRLLGGALDALEAACYEFREQFEVPDLKVNLAKKIHFSFWGITKAEAESIAAESIAIADGTHEALKEAGEAA